MRSRAPCSRSGDLFGPATYFAGRPVNCATHREVDGSRPPSADYKKAYVYLQDEQGHQNPRYHEVEFQLLVLQLFCCLLILLIFQD